MSSDHVSAFLAEFFRRQGYKKAMRRAQAVLLWPQVAGPDVARFTNARTLRDGVLYIDVSDAETAMHLNLQRQRFLDVYHARFEQRGLKEVRFGVGRIQAKPEPEPAAPPPPADPQQQAALARSLGALRLPDDVTAAAMRAGNAMLRYKAKRAAEGWTACPTCGALHPGPELCDACTRYASSPRVRGAAERLATSPGLPTPELGDDERAVAERLAAAQLDDALAALLPQVLGDPTLRPQLELLARTRAALASGKPVEAVRDQDLLALDVRVLRVLGVA